MSRSEAAAVPLALSRERVALYGGVLVLLALATPLIVRIVLRLDLAQGNWQNFQSAGATVGTRNLLDPQLHGAWQAAHHLPVSAFAYPPGVAWLYWPFAHMSTTSGIAINAAFVAVACVLSALLAARTFGVSSWFALLAVFAWQPALDSIQTGENGAVVMLLAFAAIWALMRRRPAVAGLAVGLMLFKPSIALAFVILLLLRREWRALIVTAAIAAAWYVAGVLATQGDVAWPLQYARLINGYFAEDFQRYSIAAMTLPAVLMRLGVASFAASLAGIAVFVAALPLLRRASLLEAGSITGLIALAATPHAWGYDAALVLPSLFFAMTNVREPARTRAVAFAYVLAAVQTIITIRFLMNPLAIVVIGGAAWWLIARYREAAIRFGPTAIDWKH
jgi:hypothetical protein